MRRLAAASLLALFFLVPDSSAATRLEPAFPGLSFARPLGLEDPRDGSGRLFVVEQAGTIRVFKNSPDARSAKLFLDLRRKVAFDGNEMGLLGLAFHPDYAKNGFFYVDYTADNPRRTVIERYRVKPGDPDSADLSSAETILEIDQPYVNHNGGQISFGPDRKLYIALGDGGSGGDPHGNAQNLRSLLGKILRIDPDRVQGRRRYAIPEDNPFARDGWRGWRGEIYAYGLRNPWRFSWGPDGRMWAGDVGQNRFEEIDVVEKGKNYGWNRLEANACFDPPQGCSDEGTVRPVWDYGRDAGVCVTGGFVYRGLRAPFLRGAYVYADFVSGRVWALRLKEDGQADNELVTESGKQIASFGMDSAGELYACAFDGKIYGFAEG